MYEIPQDSEQYILQWWNDDNNMRGLWVCSGHKEAIHRMELYRRSDKILGANFKYRIVRKTTKHEVVYND